MTSAVQIIVVVCLLTIGPCAMVLNGLVIAISFIKKLKVYKYFICNLAIADFLFSVLFTFFQAYFVLFLEINNWVCSVVSFLSLTSMFAMMYSLPLLAINRYVNLYKSHLYPKLYSRRMSLFFCICVWLYCAFIVTPFTPKGTISGSFDRAPNGLLCFGAIGDNLTSATTAVESLVHLSLISTAVLGFCILAFCCYKVYRNLKVQQESLMNLNRIQALRNKTLLKACVIQGVLPIMSFLPMVVYVGIRLSYGISKIRGTDGAEWGLFMVSVLLNALFDALTTLCVVGAYRDSMSTRSTGGRLF